MLDVVHLQSLHDPFSYGACGSSCDPSVAYGVHVGQLPRGMSRHELDVMSHSFNFHSQRFGRSTATAFSHVGEEERREPTWPLMLVSYYKMKIKEMQKLAMKYALQKIEAERDAFRAHAAEEYANKEADDAREDAEEIDNGPDDTIEQLEQKIIMQKPKEDAVKDEVVASTNLLDADDRRDMAMQKQIEAMQKEMIYENKLRAAMAEQQMRSERRNLVPGVVAVDCSGRQIVTKASCDAEKNTIFRDGTCIVSGGENPPDSPEEMRAANQAREDEEQIEAAEEEVEAAAKGSYGPRASAKAAQINLQAAEAELSREKKVLADDSKGAPVFFGKAEPKQQKQMDSDNSEIKRQEAKVEELRKAWKAEDTKAQAAEKKLTDAQNKEDNLRKQHIQDLKTLNDEENKVEAEDVEEMNKDDQIIKGAHEKMDHAQMEVSEEELAMARALREEYEKLMQESEHRDGVMQKDLQEEARETQLWEKEAEWEAEAAQHKDLGKEAVENIAQKNAYFSEKKAARDAERDAYSHGEDTDVSKETPLDPDDPDYGMKMAMRAHKLEVTKNRQRLVREEAKAVKQLDGSFKDEKVASDDTIIGNLKKADAEEERNSTALREAETLHKLREEEHEIKRRKNATSSLGVHYAGWPMRRCTNVPAFLESPRLSTSKSRPDDGGTAFLSLRPRRHNLKLFL